LFTCACAARPPQSRLANRTDHRLERGTEQGAQAELPRPDFASQRARGREAVIPPEGADDRAWPMSLTLERHRPGAVRHRFGEQQR
jgi:hypothetical protein